MKLLRLSLLMVLFIFLLQGCASTDSSKLSGQEAKGTASAQNDNKPDEKFYTPKEDEKRLEETKVKESTGVPSVLIIGDSISIGYTPFVKTRLEGVVNVTKIPGNGGDTANCLKILKETPEKWLGTNKRYDVIVFNAGLWDVAYRIPGLPANGNLDKVKGTITATPEKYKENLNEIVKILKGTGSKLLWASITVVPENEPGRNKGDEVKYNEIAKKIMDDNKIDVIDLYAVSKSFDPSLSQEPGNVHFKSEGYKILGEKVAESIEKLLGK